MQRSHLLRGSGLVLLILFTLSALPAEVRLADVDTHCPLFGHSFTAQALAGEDQFAAFDSDLCKRPQGTDLYTLSVWTCPFCFFSAYQSDFRAELAPEFREMELRRYPLEKPPSQMEQWEIFVGVKYHNAETFYLKAGKDAWFLSDLALRATYAFRVSTVEETEEFAALREHWLEVAWKGETRYSVEEVNLALAARIRQELKGKVAMEQVPVLRYLLADALRRAGEHREAIGIFEELQESTALPAVLARGARMQFQLCRKEGEFQQKALAYLRQAEEEGIVPEENRALAVYLQAELSRRQGDFKAARALYHRAAELPASQDWLAALIEKQEGRLDPGKKKSRRKGS
jgi:hypothetical protein